MGTTRRMLSRNITASKKVAKLKDPWEKLLYTWLFPFTDDYGRFHADPYLLKGFIFPLEQSITPEYIEKMLVEIANRKLIILYDYDGSGYLEVCNFEKFQTFRKDRNRVAEYPAPDGKPKVSAKELNDTVKEDKGKEDKEEEKVIKLDYEAIKDKWNEEEWRDDIKKITTSRQDKLKLRVKEMEKLGVTWADLFRAIDKQKAFLSGKNNTSWKMTFDWLIANDTNWVKVYELKYLKAEKSDEEEPPHPGMVRSKENGAWIFPEQ